jgi:hypothetical protein
MFFAMVCAAQAQEYTCTVSADPAAPQISLHDEPKGKQIGFAWPGAALATLKATGDDSETWIEVGAARTEPSDANLIEGYVAAASLQCPEPITAAGALKRNLTCQSIGEPGEMLGYLLEPGAEPQSRFAVGTKFLVSEFVEHEGALWAMAEGYVTLNPVGWVLETEFERCERFE